MKKLSILILLFSFVISGLIAQETDEAEVKVKDKPVRTPWESGILIDHQTSVVPVKNTLQFVIQHKFGTMDNGRSDLWGIYAPGANVRLALDFVPCDNVQIGMGITKKNMYTDFNLKWTIFEQTRKNTVPVSVTLFGVAAIDGRNEDVFGIGRVQRAFDAYRQYQFKFADRLSYFSQLIVGRKFNEWLSLQTAVSFTHFNSTNITNVQVPDGRYIHEDHDKIALHFSGRAKISPQMSFIFNYDLPLKIKDISEQVAWLDDYPKPNLAIGAEIATSTHAFQIYVGGADGIIPQNVVLYNANDWTDGGLAFGFTITRLWNF